MNYPWAIVLSMMFSIQMSEHMNFSDSYFFIFLLRQEPNFSIMNTEEGAFIGQTDDLSPPLLLILQVSVYSPSSRTCTPAWLERSLACCWRQITLSCSTCWSLPSLSAPRWMKLLPCCRLTRPRSPPRSPPTLLESPAKNPVTTPFFF